MLVRALVLILFVAALSGCAASRREQCTQTILANLTEGIEDPTTVRERIAGADRIVITNRFAYDIKKYQGFSMTITGPEVKRVIGAVLAAERRDLYSRSIWDWNFKFYRKTNYLASIYCQGDGFLLAKDPPNIIPTTLDDGAVGPDEYTDETGVLDKIYEDLIRQTEE